jgi:succinoglycan biosynthesis protein ExoO
MNIMKRLVSIIMPAYNAEKYIGNAIESVLAQTYPYFEFIIVNDGSKDKTTETVKVFKDKRIKFIDLPENRGVSEARNVALSYAKGDWIAFIDADDAWKPERLEVLLGILSKYNYGEYFIADDSIVCFDTPAGLKPFGSEFMLSYKELYNLLDSKNLLVLSPKDFINFRTPLIHPIVPSKAIKENNLKFNPSLNYAEDLEFYFQLFKIGLKLILTKEAMYFYRLTPGSLTAQKPSDSTIKALECLVNQGGFPSEETKLLKNLLEERRKENQYKMFTYAIKNKDVKNFLRLTIKDPFLVLKLLIRLPKSIKYRIIALLNGGQIK